MAIIGGYHRWLSLVCITNIINSFLHVVLQEAPTEGYRPEDYGECQALHSSGTEKAFDSGIDSPDKTTT